MNAASRLRSLVAALGALVLLTVGACSSADDDQASSSASSASSASSSAAQTVSDAPVSASDNVIPPATTDPSAPDSSAEIEMNTGTAGSPDPGIPAATTEVPPPGGLGDINRTVPEVSLPTAAPVAVSETAESGTGVKVAVTNLRRITSVAELPGEIAGPALEVTLTVLNDSNVDVDLNLAQVNLQDSAGTPAIPMSASPADPFAGSVPADGTATAVYVFTLPTSYVGPATISFSYTTEAPVLLFVGDAS